MTKLDRQQEQVLRRGVIQIVPEGAFAEALLSGRKLRLKFGLDPSKPDLHIGHGVLLRRLRVLQGMGHQVVLIVGDWTAQIGDPSGQSVMRPMLTGDEVRANAETYMKQFFHVVDKSKTEVRWQSEWFDKFSLADTVRLAARFTVAQLLQREDFRSRYEAKKPLGIHELFYPLLQAYDSVAINADVEFGGTDQLFNLLVGRELQQEVGQHPQICVTMRLLVGTDGAQKMSKSLGNTVDLEDPPLEKYGKLMSIPDDAILDYLELATDISDEELVDIGGRLKSKLGNPMDVKKRLARDVITQFHGEDAAQDADREWARVYSGHEEPARVDEFRLPLSRPSESDLSEHSDGSWRWSIVKILVRAGLASSNSEARRLLRANAVEIDGEVQGSTSVVLHHGATFRVGKHRFLRIVDADGIDEAS